MFANPRREHYASNTGIRVMIVSGGFPDETEPSLMEKHLILFLIFTRSIRKTLLYYIAGHCIAATNPVLLCPLQVGKVSAWDADEGTNGQVSYTVISDWGNDVFSLNPQTGYFTLTSRLDYEQVKTSKCFSSPTPSFYCI